jgi:hypothetical protein
MSEGTDNTKAIMFCITLMVLGLFYFLFKIEACKPDPKVDKNICHDEYVHLNDGWSKDCPPGAHAEIVKDANPPAMICRCDLTTDAGK